MTGYTTSLRSRPAEKDILWEPEQPRGLSRSTRPGTYNPEIRPPPKVTWPMKFGSPDWAQVPCLQKRTLKAELPTDKDFRRHRNRLAYLRLFYN
ncbi:primary cilia formation [Phyllostomus discolor]|uniref:Primary cilia formation n=1 Tax=Phyllostomus discolor TaxID=89673 RepID=A0A833Y9V9_9CHIR|nr:primary cilia formation [Phyllostomus discolor]